MPVIQSFYEGETMPIVFPLTINDVPANLTGITEVTMIKAGLNGKLGATVVSGITIYSAQEGLVKWVQTSGDLKASESPYRIYFRCVGSGGYFTIPRADYFLVYAYPSLL